MANKVSNKLRVFNTLNKVYATSVGMEIIKNSAEFLKEEKVTISSNVRKKETLLIISDTTQETT